MYRIDSINSVSGHFSDGDYRTGRKGTKVPAHWMNAVQGELCNFVAANGIALNKNDNGQVLKALEKKIKGYFDRYSFLQTASGNELFVGTDIVTVNINPGGILDFNLIAYSTSSYMPDIDLSVKSGSTTEKHAVVKMDGAVGIGDFLNRRFCLQNESSSAKSYDIHLSSGLDNTYTVYIVGYRNKI